MKTLAALIVLMATGAVAQETATDGSIFEALKVGDWVAYNAGSTRELLDLTVVDDKPANTSIKYYREEQEKSRTDASVARAKYNEAIAALRSERLTSEERAAKQAAIESELGQISRNAEGRRSGFRSLSTGPYEVTAIRREYIVLSSGTHEQFVAKSAIRMIRRKLPVERQ
jgi:hypothetical protein